MDDKEVIELNKMECVYIIDYVRTPLEDEYVAAEKRFDSIINKYQNNGLIDSYSIASSEFFPFPHKKPDTSKLKDFFKGVDESQIEEELKELYDEPRQEMSTHFSNFKQKVDSADKEGLLEIFDEKYESAFKEKAEVPHICENKKRLETYNNAIKKVQETLKINGLEDYLLESFDSSIRREFIDALNIVNNIHLRNYIHRRKEIEDIFDERIVINPLAGNRLDIARSMVFRYCYKSNVDETTQFFRSGLNSSFGSFMARVTTNNLEELKEKLKKKNLNYFVTASST